MGPTFVPGKKFMMFQFLQWRGSSLVNDASVVSSLLYLGVKIRRLGVSGACNLQHTNPLLIDTGTGPEMAGVMSKVAALQKTHHWQTLMNA